MGSRRWRPGERALSPVVGATLLIAIVVATASVAGTLALGLAETGDSAPSAAVDIEASDGAAVELLITHGDEIDPERVTVRGAETGAGFEDAGPLRAGDSVRVYPTDDEIDLFWNDPDTDRSLPLATLDVPHTDGIVTDGVAWDGRLVGEQVTAGRNAPEEYYPGVSFEVRNVDDDPRELERITVDVDGESDVDALYSSESSRPETCSGPDDGTTFCPLLLVDVEDGTDGLFTEDVTGDGPTFEYVIDAAGGDPAYDPATIAPGSTAEISVYRFQVAGGDDVHPFSTAHVPGTELAFTLTFSDGATLEARTAVSGPKTPAGFTVEDAVAVDDTVLDELGDLELPGLRSTGRSVDVETDDGYRIDVGGTVRSDTGDVALETDGADSPVTVTGDVHAGQDVDIDPEESSIDIGGDVRSDAGAIDLSPDGQTLDGEIVVGGSLVADGPVDVDTDEGPVTIEGAVASESGAVSLQADAAPVDIAGGVAADGRLTIDADEDSFDVGGDVRSDSSVDIDADDGVTTVRGTVRGSGDVDFQDEVIVRGDVVSENGDVQLSPETTVEGDVVAENGSVDRNGATVEGDVVES